MSPHVQPGDGGDGVDSPIIDALERALYSHLARQAGAQMIREPDWVQLTTPGAATEYRNGVLRSVLDDVDVNRRIEVAEARRICRLTPVSSCTANAPSSPSSKIRTVSVA